MAHNPGKYHSFGVFTSASAVKSRPSEDLKKLYFKTTQNDSFARRDVSPRGRAESLGAIHEIGKKKTKYMDFQYKRAPCFGRDSCWYAKDYNTKMSESKENRELAECFRGPTSTVHDAPMMETTSCYAQNHLFPSKRELRSAVQASRAPENGRTKTIGGTDLNLETQSSTHRLHPAPARGFNSTGQTMWPTANLYVSGLDSGDCYRTTYSNEFWKKQVPSGVGPVQRSASAPGSTRGGAGASEVSSGRDPAIHNTRRNIFTSPGK